MTYNDFIALIVNPPGDKPRYKVDICEALVLKEKVKGELLTIYYEITVCVCV